MLSIWLAIMGGLSPTGGADASPGMQFTGADVALTVSAAAAPDPVHAPWRAAWDDADPADEGERDLLADAGRSVWRGPASIPPMGQDAPGRAPVSRPWLPPPRGLA